MEGPGQTSDRGRVPSSAAPRLTGPESQLYSAIHLWSQMMTETLLAQKYDDSQGSWERCVRSGQKYLAFSRRDTLGSVFLKLMERWMETACLHPMGLSASENSHPWLS